MILISKTYSVWTPEDLEHGESSESGYDFEDVEYSFRELVELMRRFEQPSQMPCDGNTRTWLTYFDEDMFSGDNTEYSLHYSRKNPPKNAKYWKLAMKVAGFIK
jgi:hypothetical protein